MRNPDNRGLFTLWKLPPIVISWEVLEKKGFFNSPLRLKPLNKLNCLSWLILVPCTMVKKEFEMEYHHHHFSSKASLIYLALASRWKLRFIESLNSRFFDFHDLWFSLRNAF